MKYKVLFVSLLLILAVSYGIAAERDCGRDAGKGNPHREATEEEIAKHEAETQRIAEEEMPRVEDVITLVNCNLKVGGKETVDLDQKFQNLTEAFNIQAASLEKSLDNLTALLTGTPGSDLFEQIICLAQEVNKDKMSNKLLRQEIDAMNREQAETNALLDDVLKQGLSLVPQLSLSQEIQAPSSILPSDTLSPVISPSLTPETPTGLSSYQQELLPRRDQIGDGAWELLGGENTSLAAALSNSIQQNSGMVDILSLERNNFTLHLNGKEQDQLYKF